MPLPNRVNEIRVRRRLSLFPHMTGDLSAMVGRVHQHMRQNIPDAAAPRLAFGVLVRDGLGEVRDTIHVLQPLAFQLLRLGLTRRQVRLRPYGDALRDLFQPFQPDSPCRQDVRHQLQRSLIFIPRGPDCVQRFPVRPPIIKKLTPQILSNIHDSISIPKTCCNPWYRASSWHDNVVTAFSHSRDRLVYCGDRKLLCLAKHPRLKTANPKRSRSTAPGPGLAPGQPRARRSGAACAEGLPDCARCCLQPSRLADHLVAHGVPCHQGLRKGTGPTGAPD